MTEITSASNELFKNWKNLDTAKGIRKAGAFFLMGEKLIQEFTANKDLQKRFPVQAEIVREDLHPTGLAGARSTFKLAKGLFNEIDFVGTHYNLLLLTLPEISSFNKDTQPTGLELICPLGDPGNLGAVIRSALAFGASRVVLSEEAAFPFSPKVVKASAGAVLHMPISRGGNLQSFSGGEIYALDMVGSDIAQFKWPKNMRLLVGEEGSGLKDMKGLMKLKINTGTVESLNATVAASIALYSYRNATQK
ncbi:TrmH family RNA methyltransferase [Bdellovibrio sp. HCB337]|uniref:TrmH family RNA methyltransferase n=1 Tax=Bdellovibrio sp. HCB337 TaxID=3394358 RepID=UPI0039A4EF7A